MFKSQQKGQKQLNKVKNRHFEMTVFLSLAYGITSRGSTCGGELDMGVMSTDEWLQKEYDEPVKMCERLVPYFDKATPSEIYQHLLIFGMYRPLSRNTNTVSKLCSKKVWNVVEKEYQRLKQLFSGSEIPIFIFPSNLLNREIVRVYNGKSGLAFRDKLFLFLSGANSESEIKALLTHEYHHVCRLNQYKKNDDQYTLADTIILEGLAESAVKECHGDNYLAPWATLYTRAQAIKMWEKYIAPNQLLPKSMKKHYDLLYGTRFSYPKMCGYSTGYHLVQQAIEKSNQTACELLSYPTDQLIEISCFGR